MSVRALTSLALTVVLAVALLHVSCPSEPVNVTAPPTAEEKLARIAKLEDERSTGGGELEAMLSDLDGRIRARAALALGRIGVASEAERMASLLADESVYVRETAALSLGILPELSQELRPTLVSALDDPSPRVRGRAAEALGRRFGEEAAEAIGTALAKHIPTGGEPYDWNESITDASLNLPNADIRLSLFALARLGSLRWSWNAIATEGRTPRFAWWPAAWVTSYLSGTELQPLDLFYAGSPDPVLRLYGTRGLAKLDRERSVAQLRPLLFDPSEGVRIEAVRATAALDARELLPDLLSHLGADTRYVQSEILEALTVLPDPASVEPLIDLVGNESPWVRSLALAALAHQDPDSFWLLMAGIGQDPAWQVRRALISIVSQVAARERKLALLTAMVDDPDGRVRAPALRELGRVDPEGAAGILIRHLGGEDPFERVAAAETLAAIGAKDAFAPIEQAYLVENDDDPRIRVLLLEALARLDPQAAAPTIENALDDPSYPLRFAAGSLLRAAGSTGVSVRPRSSERSVDDYLSSVTAPYSPQAFIETSRGRLEVELFIADAPRAVENFVRLARSGFYQGLSFYEVVPNDHVSSGDPRNDGHGGPGYTIRTELSPRPVLRGTIAMSEERKDFGGSRFFITHLPDPILEGRVTVFGHVTRGMEIVDRLEPGDVIESVTIWDGVTSPYRP